MNTLIFAPTGGDTAVSSKPTILTRKAMLNRVGLSYSTIHELIRQNQFPSSIALTTRRRGWLENEIEAWISERVDASRKIGT